jgi:hypothetical protein
LRGEHDRADADPELPRRAGVSRSSRPATTSATQRRTTRMPMKTIREVQGVAVDVLDDERKNASRPMYFLRGSPTRTRADPPRTLCSKAPR